MPGVLGRRRTIPRSYVRVSVWSDDIERGVRGDAARNPLALAIVRELNVAKALVTRSAATLVWSSPRRDVEVVSLPVAARLFMIRFEAPIPVEPFTFRLAVVAVPGQSIADAASELGLPASAREAAARIRARAQALLDRADEFPVGSRDLFMARRALETYLPRTVSAYVELTEPQRGEPIAPDGRTGRQVLAHELELIEARLDEIGAELDRARTARLLAQERFLEDQLGDGPPGR
jgi:hypothetical protein